MKKTIIKTASVLALTFGSVNAPVWAQDSDGIIQGPAEAEEAPVDAARLKAATTTVDYLFPLGTYERMMKGTMDQLMDSMITSMGGMTIGDLAGAGGVDDGDIPEGEGAKTLAEISEELDPDYQERMKITTKVMMDEMVDLMTSMEPVIRTSLTKIYARKYTAPQLAEMNSFFATDTGSAFARDYMMVFVDPEMMQAMMGMVPEMMQAMPDIMKKVEEATAHLPPVKMDDPFASVDDVMDEAEGAEAACEDNEVCEVAVASDDYDDGNDGHADYNEEWEKRENWSKADRETVDKLDAESDDLMAKYWEATETAQENARKRLKNK